MEKHCKYLQTMKLSICTWILLMPGVSTFKQNVYKIIFERAEMVRFNTTYVNFARTHNFKYNRTNAVVNMTFGLKYDLVGNLDVEVQAYKLASNEYRLFPLRFSFNFCEYARRNEFNLGELYQCGNLTGCPCKKGIHRICNWALKGNRSPPHIPQGSYMLDLKYIYRGVEGLFFQLFATVKYPELKF